MVTGWCKLKAQAQVEIYINFFLAMVSISVSLGIMDFSHIVILCNGANSFVANKSLSVLICLYYP